jgi:hypothetical protein
MKGKTLTIDNVKHGDKVAYNEEGKAFNKKHYYTINFNEVIYGVVVSFRNGIRPIITLELYNHKGIMVNPFWHVYADHLEYYEGSN